MVRSGLFLLGLIAAAADGPLLPPAANIRADFARDIEPILKARCQVCHGPQQQMNGLRLDRGEDALRGGKSGPVILPGKSAESKLIQFVAGQKMPPVGSKLTAAEVGILRAWIDQGAKWPKAEPHWAFQKIRRPELPAIRKQAWTQNPIDRFVLARLEAEGIEPSPEADRRTLLRRLSLDLIGLPPKPEETAEFLTDPRPDAYQHVVDRLLASPHYGEKWARHWLDLARYADSDGYESDLPRPHAWRYRQWVIEALNRDLPFDRFTIEQLAGDLLPNATIEQKVATGFNRNTLTNREGGVDTEQFRVEEVFDRTNTLGTVWLGLTVGCAQCHDHKYDPISQKEYYRLFAFFNPAHELDIDAPLPGEIGPYLARRPEYAAKRRALLEEYGIPELQAEWEHKLLEAAANPGQSAEWDKAWKYLGNNMVGGQAIVKLDPAQRTEKQRDQIADYFIARFGDAFGKERLAKEKIDELRKKLKELKPPEVSMAQTLAEFGERRRTHVLHRGDFRDPGEEVTPGTPAVLASPPPGSPPSRLTLARWLVSPENPLTARVTVNRMWQEFFGRGLVRTSEDFGTQGERPSHPALLDWLASEFMDRGWSMKHMHRLIVTSATYRQSSRSRPEIDSRDPDNVLVARQSRLRLPAELIRDSALAVSGLLNPAIGGRSVRPPLPAGVAQLGYASGVKWEETQGPDRYRRGLYIHFQRTVPFPQLMNFDAPDAYLACSRRQRSNTPLQALDLLNDPVFFEASQALALRLLREVPGGFASRFGYGFELCLSRRPTARETERMAAYFEKQVDILRNDPKEAQALFPHALDGVDPAEAAAWAAAGRVLLNLDEFIHRE
ncbi:MAG: PSD1 domain-containing protein [Acidobacteria bacterium]|nr:PSD1 domain-containing protein [Acidobacteriota bacterium]